jgi:hypothetical protein
LNESNKEEIMHLKKSFLLILTTVILLTGCATVTPIPELVSIGNPSASKISITSIHETNIFNKNAVLPGKIYVNSKFYGEFSESQRNFSVEVLPGTQLVVICPVNQAQCINAQVNVLPNKNYKFKYTLETQYLVIMSNYIWKLIPTGVEDYFPVANATTRTGMDNKPTSINSNIKTQSDSMSPQAKPVGNVSSDDEKKMEISRVRCTELGFQVATQSFGECILRLSK